MTKLFTRFLKDESGATAIEYGLIAALISVGIIAGATSWAAASTARSTNSARRWTELHQLRNTIIQYTLSTGAVARSPYWIPNLIFSMIFGISFSGSGFTCSCLEPNVLD